jgi:hypothetical protein
MSRISIFLLLLLTAVLPIKEALAAPVPGDRLPSIVLTSEAGGSKPVWNKGKITIVAFCAFWCDTWKEQDRRMTAAREALRGMPVTWTMVSVDGRWADKGRGGSQNNIARSALLDVGGHWTNRLGIRSVPTTLVVDGAGQVRYAGQGIARSQTLLNVVRSVLAGEKATVVPVRFVFNDFPSRDWRLDDRLLDILRAAGVRVTFQGDTARQRASPVIMRRALAEGHLVRGNLSASRRGVVDPFDWKRPGHDELRRRVLWGAAPGKTILLHAGVPGTVEALEDILNALRQRGLRLEKTP